MAIIRHGVLLLTGLFTAIAGISDWRTRRIPNWLTVPGLVLGIGVNFAEGKWMGVRESLLGAGLGLLLLLPFVLIRSLGAGDWKLVGALGAFLGPHRLLAVLFLSVLIAGVMALILIVWKGRVRQTLRNITHMLAAFFSFHLPGPEVSLENPESLKVPFGVAVAGAVLFYVVAQLWGVA